MLEVRSDHHMDPEGHRFSSTIPAEASRPLVVSCWNWRGQNSLPPNALVVCWDRRCFKGLTLVADALLVGLVGSLGNDDEVDDDVGIEGRVEGLRESLFFSFPLILCLPLPLVLPSLAWPSLVL